MHFYMDESGNTGDIAATSNKLDFGGQPVFSLAAIGIPNEESLGQALITLRRKHNVQATELKLSRIIIEVSVNCDITRARPGPSTRR